MDKAQIGELTAEYSSNIDEIRNLTNALSGMGEHFRMLGEALGRPTESVTPGAAPHQYVIIKKDKRGGRSETTVDADEARLRKLLTEFRDRLSRKRQMEADLRNQGLQNLIKP